MKKFTEEQLGDEGINYTVRDLSIEEIIPNVIDNFMVTIFEDHHTIILPSTITGIQFKAWARERGGIFSKDVLNYTLTKTQAKYVHIKGNNVNCIARLITDEELFSFETLKLVDGQIKDTSYMILRHLNDNDMLTNTKKIIMEKDIYLEVDSIILTPSPKIAHEDDADYHVGSVSLFTE